MHQRQQARGHKPPSSCPPLATSLPHKLQRAARKKEKIEGKWNGWENFNKVAQWLGWSCPGPWSLAITMAQEMAKKKEYVERARDGSGKVETIRLALSAHGVRGKWHKLQVKPSCLLLFMVALNDCIRIRIRIEDALARGALVEGAGAWMESHLRQLCACLELKVLASSL